jgi:hypothetical protein
VGRALSSPLPRPLSRAAGRGLSTVNERSRVRIPPALLPPDCSPVSPGVARGASAGGVNRSCGVQGGGMATSPGPYPGAAGSNPAPAIRARRARRAAPPWRSGRHNPAQTRLSFAGCRSNRAANGSGGATMVTRDRRREAASLLPGAFGVGASLLAGSTPAKSPVRLVGSRWWLWCQRTAREGVILEARVRFPSVTLSRRIPGRCSVGWHR